MPKQKRNSIAKRLEQWSKALRVTALYAGVFLFALSVATVMYQGGTEVFQAAIIEQGSVIDPLQNNTQCSDRSSVILPISGGGPDKTVEFIGTTARDSAGSLIYGTVSNVDGASIDEPGEVLDSAGGELTYTAPAGSTLDTIAGAEVSMRVTDAKAVDPLTGEFSSVDLTIALTASCIDKLEFVDPDGDDTHVVNKGKAFDLRSVLATLSNGDTILYDLASATDILFAVDPGDSGFFQGLSFFPLFSNGKAVIFAFLPEESLATLKLVTTNALNVTFGESACPTEIDLELGSLITGASQVLEIKNGIPPFSITATSNLSVTPLAPESTPTGEGETPPPSPPAGLFGDKAIVTAVSPGEGIINVLSSDGCVGSVQVLVDLFAPDIVFAQYLGGADFAPDTSRNVIVEVRDPTGISADKISFEALLVKGVVNSLDDLEGKTFVLDVINFRESVELTAEVPTEPTDAELAADPGSSPVRRTFNVPIFAPENPNLTDGRYTLVVIMTSQDVTSAGPLTSTAFLPTYIGASFFDLNDDKQVDLVDGILILRSIAEGNIQFTLQDFIVFLRNL